MLVRDLIQMSYLLVMTDLTLVLFIIFNSTISSLKKTHFLFGVGTAMIMLICNWVTYRFEGSGRHILLVKIFVALSYSVSGPVMLPFILLTSVISKKVQRVLICAASANALLSFVSLFTGCVFRVDDTGKLTLTKLALIPFGLSGVYIAVLFAASIIKFRLGFHSESLFIFVLSGGIITAVIMNTFLGFRFLVSGMASLSCMFYYMFFTSQTLVRDALTNALNRHSFYRDIKLMQKHGMYVISIDLNGLKKLNDTLGHDAGDKAILATSESAFSTMPVKCKFYRMGGDEFEILYPEADEAMAAKLVSELKESVSKKGYSIAAGYAEYKKGMDINEVISLADAVMYDDKVSMKALREE